MKYMKASNLGSGTITKAGKLHEVGIYLGIDRKIYDFVATECGNDILSATPIKEAIRDNFIEIETTISKTTATVLGMFLKVDTKYKISGMDSTKFYEIR